MTVEDLDRITAVPRSVAYAEQQREPKPLDPRPEGVYCEWQTYPPEGGAYSVRLLKIERVAGDGSVMSIEITGHESKIILEFLKASL